MSKELEEIKSIVAIHFGALGFLNPCENEQILKDRDKVLNALNRLESIDNAEPSEALKKLDDISYLVLNEIDDLKNKELWKSYFNNIKQALIKAEKEHNSINLLMQELDCKDFAELRKYARCGYEKLNKKYLKWEDLEFEDFPKEIEVRIGDNICKLEYRVSMLGNKTVILMGNNKIYLQLFENGKQFFNDLHLEVIV